MSWADFWCWFKANPELQQETLEIIKIKELIASLSSRYQIEVLQDAPKNILDIVSDVLDDKTIKKLGYRKQFTQVWLT